MTPDKVHNYRNRLETSRKRNDEEITGSDELTMENGGSIDRQLRVLLHNIDERTRDSDEDHSDPKKMVQIKEAMTSNPQGKEMSIRTLTLVTFSV